MSNTKTFVKFTCLLEARSIDQQRRPLLNEKLEHPCWTSTEVTLIGRNNQIRLTKLNKLKFRSSSVKITAMIHVKYSLFRKKDTFYTRLKHNRLNSLILYTLKCLDLTNYTKISSQTGVLDNRRRNFTQGSLNELFCVQLT